MCIRASIPCGHVSAAPGRVPFHREEVEAAVRAVHVELFREVREVTPGARSLSLARDEIHVAARTLVEAFPSRHRLTSSQLLNTAAAFR